MFSIVWDKPDERYYHHGVDHGVFYPDNGAPVPWNGITGITESGTGSKSVLYRDGQIFHASVDPGDFEGQLTAYYFPDEFAECAGLPQATQGLVVDNQRPQRFSLSYRTLVGSGAKGDKFGYQIHLVYNAVATIGSRSRKTKTSQPELVDFTFDLIATPVRLPGFRPTAHYILDMRNVSPTKVARIEGMLYGDGETPGYLPSPEDLYDILEFGDAISFFDNGDGTWFARGARENVHWLDDGTWEILNVNGTDNGDGTFELQDTP